MTWKFWKRKYSFGMTHTETLACLLLVVLVVPLPSRGPEQKRVATVFEWDPVGSVALMWTFFSVVRRFDDVV